MRVIVVLLLLVAAGILAVGAYWLNPPGSRPLAIPRADPAPTAVAAPDVAPKAQAARGEISVDLTEAELTQALQQQLVGRELGQTPLGRATVERIEARLRSGLAQVSGTAQLGGTSVPYLADLSAAPDAAGRARVQLADAKVAGIPMPEVARAPLETTIQGQLDRLLATRPMRVRDIEIGAGRMRVIGTPSG